MEDYKCTYYSKYRQEYYDINMSLKKCMKIISKYVEIEEFQIDDFEIEEIQIDDFELEEIKIDNLDEFYNDVMILTIETFKIANMKYKPEYHDIMDKIPLLFDALVFLEEKYTSISKSVMSIIIAMIYIIPTDCIQTGLNSIFNKSSADKNLIQFINSLVDKVNFDEEFIKRLEDWLYVIYQYYEDLREDIINLLASIGEKTQLNSFFYNIVVDGIVSMKEPFIIFLKIFNQMMNYSSFSSSSYKEHFDAVYKYFNSQVRAKDVRIESVNFFYNYVKRCETKIYNFVKIRNAINLLIDNSVHEEYNGIITLIVSLLEYIPFDDSNWTFIYDFALKILESNTIQGALTIINSLIKKNIIIKDDFISYFSSNHIDLEDINLENEIYDEISELFD